MSDRITRILALAEAATPGPWQTRSYDGRCGIAQESSVEANVAKHVCCRDYGDGPDCSGCGPSRRVPDGEFIAASRTEVPWLATTLQEALRLLTEFGTKEEHTERIHAFLARVRSEVERG